MDLPICYLGYNNISRVSRGVLLATIKFPKELANKTYVIKGSFIAYNKISRGYYIYILAQCKKMVCQDMKFDEDGWLSRMQEPSVEILRSYEAAI
jgi:hypothetical protein